MEQGMQSLTHSSCRRRLLRIRTRTGRASALKNETASNTTPPSVQRLHLRRPAYNQRVPSLPSPADDKKINILILEYIIRRMFVVVNTPSPNSRHSKIGLEWAITV